jgi:hypothetical protein
MYFIDSCCPEEGLLGRGGRLLGHSDIYYIPVLDPCHPLQGYNICTILSQWHPPPPPTTTAIFRNFKKSTKGLYFGKCGLMGKKYQENNANAHKKG